MHLAPTILTLCLLIAISLCCNTPASFWCDHADIARECGVANQCARQRRQVTHVPTNLTVLFETHCPHCQKFIVNTLYPTWRRYRHYVNIEFVPWGNAKRDPITQKITCLHGKEECDGNRLVSCTLSDIAAQTNVTKTAIASRSMHYVYCIEKHLHANMDIYHAWKRCFRVTRVHAASKRNVKRCFLSEQGDQLQRRDEHRTKSVSPEPATHSPWIVVNGRSTHGMQTLKYSIDDLLKQWHNLDVAYQGSADGKPRIIGVSQVNVITPNQ